MVGVRRLLGLLDAPLGWLSPSNPAAGQGQRGDGCANSCGACGRHGRRWPQVARPLTSGTSIGLRSSHALLFALLCSVITVASTPFPAFSLASRAATPAATAPSRVRDRAAPQAKLQRSGWASTPLSRARSRTESGRPATCCIAVTARNRASTQNPLGCWHRDAMLRP